MSMRKKLIFQYVRQFFGFVLVILLCMVASLLILGLRLTKEEITSDLSRLSADDLRLQLEIKKDAIHVDKQVERSVERHDGWLQIIDQQGKAIYSYRTPADVPVRYTTGEWISSSLQTQTAAPYHVQHWILDLQDQKVIVLYGTPAPEARLLERVLAHESAVALKDDFSQESAWLAVYDRSGRLVEQWNRPDASSQLHLTEVLQTGRDGINSPFNIVSRYDAQSGKTYVVGTPNPSYKPGEGALSSSEIMVLEGLRSSMLLMLACVLAAGIWYALRVGKPLLHMVNWLEQLAKGRYEEPVSKSGKQIGVTRRGKWKRSFAVFKDMFDALKHLSVTLRTNEQQQRDMERTREEWITGLSHDLKTPLSSIFGYAAILESEQYEWGSGEIRQFGRTIREKADYMKGLIEDLNLTYRLKNNALPMVKEKTEVIETIRRITVDMVNDPGAQGHDIEFQTQIPAIVGLVDEKWFRRIIANIVANAIKHTPEGTHVLIMVCSRQEGGFDVQVTDDGPGMDEETRANLFERYYRGGHTDEDVSGTGLGMAIARQLVLAHNGEISVDSEPGKGTTVRLSFPG